MVCGIVVCSQVLKSFLLNTIISLRYILQNQKRMQGMTVNCTNYRTNEQRHGPVTGKCTEEIIDYTTATKKTSTS